MPSARLDGDRILVEAPLYDADRLRALGCTGYDRAAGAWVLPAEIDTATALDRSYGIVLSFDASLELLLKSAPPADPEAYIKTADPATLPDWPLQTRPWKHQKLSYHWALPKPAAYLHVRMGGGKSASAVAQVEGRGHNKILILCPKSVVGGWPRQFRLHGLTGGVISAPREASVAARVGKMQQALALAAVRDERVVIVANYESVLQKSMADFIKKTGFDLVILDEAHRVKSPTGRISGNLWRLLRGQSCRRIALSGSPTPHSPLDIFAQYRILDETIYGTTWTQFKRRYAAMNPVLPGKVDALINVDELARKMGQIMFIVDDLGLDLPPVTQVTHEVHLGPKGRKAYREIEREFWTQVERGEVTAANALTRSVRLQQLASGFLVLDRDDENWQEAPNDRIVELDTAKQEALADLLDGLPQREPVVIFARFHHDLDVARRVAEAQGRRYGEVSGRKAGQNTLVDSQFPPDVDVLGVQLKAGGVGIDLTRSAQVIYYGLSWSLEELDQSMARVDRPGQARPVTVHHLVSTGTIDIRIRTALAERRDVIRAVMEKAG